MSHETDPSGLTFGGLDNPQPMKHQHFREWLLRCRKSNPRSDVKSCGWQGLSSRCMIASLPGVVAVRVPPVLTGQGSFSEQSDQRSQAPAELFDTPVRRHAVRDCWSRCVRRLKQPMAEHLQQITRTSRCG
ncbi:hypothetical protein ACFXO9_30695 [Nocardia tengchongensis]|uniref:hypothetical protein n=1 Tax=Nocardia tengchongensis TaxID=2055889 RepID=UPI0036A9F3D8